MRPIKTFWPHLVFAGTTVLATVLALQLAAHQRRLAALERALRERAETSAPRPSAEAPLALPPVLAPAPPRAQAQAVAAAPPGSEPQDPRSLPAPSHEDQVLYAETIYSQQPLDTGWARDAEPALQSGLRELLGSSTLDGLECRQTLCRARLHHEDAARFSEFLDRLVGDHQLWKGAITSYREAAGPDGVVRSSIYFAKEGTTVPRLE